MTRYCCDCPWCKELRDSYARPVCICVEALSESYLQEVNDSDSCNIEESYMMEDEYD